MNVLYHQGKGFKVLLLIIVSLCIVFVADIFFGYVFRNSPYGIYKKLHQIIEESNYYDVYMIGSSRVETAFETNIISQKTSLKFFNAGIHGAKPPQTYYLLKHIFRQHPLPRLVVFDIDVHNISDKDSVLNIEQFAPFMHHPSLRKNFATIDKRIIYAYYIPMYELSFYGLRGIAKLARTLLKMPGRYDTAFQISGCYHSHTDYQKSHYPDTTHPFSFHPINIAYIDSVIELCRKNKVDILLTVSPVFQPDSNIANAVHQLKKYCENKNVVVMDFSDVPSISGNIHKFSDKYHLKFNGSVEMSHIFSDSIVKYLHSNTFHSQR